MGSLCEEMITAAAKIVATRDKELMDDIVTMEEEINQKERDIERICMKLLMQQQPVASDLRVISAAMKMVSDMERIGDQACDITGIVKKDALCRATQQGRAVPVFCAGTWLRQPLPVPVQQPLCWVHR